MDAIMTQDKLQASLKFAEANDMIKAGFMANDAERKYYRTDSNVDGGFLCPPEWDSMIAKKIVEVSPMRQLCRVTTIGSKSINIPVRNSLGTAYFEGEAQASVESNSKYGNIEIFTNALTAEHHITYEMLNNGYYDMEAEITSDTALQYARAEGLAVLQGTGVKSPHGLMLNSDVGITYTGDATGITFNSIKKLVGELKVGYNPTFILNRRTIAYLSTLKNTIGQYLWQEGSVGEGVPSKLCGLPYVSVIDMDDIGANKFPVALGDFKEAYRIVDRFGMYLIRDEVTAASGRIIKFFFHKYMGGNVVKAEAIKKLQCHA
jgi:HK97 family phage major capsid protein